MTSPDRGSLRVLVHAPIGRDASASADLLHGAGLTACVCSDLPSLLIEIEAGAGAVFIAEEGLFGKDLGALAAWIGQQPAWSDLPFIVLTSRHDQRSVMRWREQLARVLRNATLLERPVQGLTLSSSLVSAVRARARQYEVRSLLEARERAALELEALVERRTQELSEANERLKREMAERAEFEESLRQAQKIEAIGQLTGGIAHDFNNLLMVITGGLSLIEKTTTVERRTQIMDGMRHAAERGTTLTGQLLAFARRKSLKAEPVDLRQQISGMRELLERTLRGNIEVRTQFSDELWTVEVDPTEFELVLLNLCVNSRDAMPAGGTITIEAHNAGNLEEKALSGDFVRLAVTDTGSGMTADVQTKVFEPFFTTKDIGKGSGLGLPQVHGFAKQSGGSVEIESMPGQGTTIVLYLPRSASAPASAQALAPAAKTVVARRAGGTVLLVEDDNEVAMLVAEMLGELGWYVVRAANGEAALQAMSSRQYIDLVFSDVMMPGRMNGLQLAREARKRRPLLPILLTSGYAGGIADEARAHNLTVLAKPYRLDELEQALSAVLRHT